MLMREIQYTVAADRHNWKYAWFGEHHGLTEYSHMSAGEVIIGHCAALTERIHLGSAIVSLPPRKEHPVRIAERAAMLDHVTNRRYEFGTGRGAGSHEVAMFNIMNTDETKANGTRSRARSRACGSSATTSSTASISPFHPAQHRAEAVRAWSPADVGRVRNPATFAKAGSLGIGAIAFNFEPIFNLKERVASYKEAIQQPTRRSVSTRTTT